MEEKDKTASKGDLTNMQQTIAEMLIDSEKKLKKHTDTMVNEIRKETREYITEMRKEVAQLREDTAQAFGITTKRLDNLEDN